MFDNREWRERFGRMGWGQPVQEPMLRGHGIHGTDISKH